MSLASRYGYSLMILVPRVPRGDEAHHGTDRDTHATDATVFHPLPLGHE